MFRKKTKYRDIFLSPIRGPFPVSSVFQILWWLKPSETTLSLTLELTKKVRVFSFMFSLRWIISRLPKCASFSFSMVSLHSRTQRKCIMAFVSSHGPNWGRSTTTAIQCTQEKTQKIVMRQILWNIGNYGLHCKPGGFITKHS